MTPAIETRNLTRHFGAITALDGVTMDVPAGSIFGFLGPNGSGKTTTMRLLLGLQRPSSGSSRVYGFDPVADSANVRLRCGVLLEHTGLYERLTALDNLLYFGRIWKIGRGDLDERIRLLLSRFALWERRTDRVEGWSRGMKQKLAIARALLHRPALLFLDEPTTGLDLMSAASLREYIAGLRDLGTTIFLNTHNLHEAEQLCDRIGVIREGRLLAVGTPEDIRRTLSGSTISIRARGLTDAIVSSLSVVKGVASLRLAADTLQVKLDGSGDVADMLQALMSSGVRIDEVRHDDDLERAVLSMLESAP